MTVIGIRTTRCATPAVHAADSNSQELPRHGKNPCRAERWPPARCPAPRKSDSISSRARDRRKRVNTRRANTRTIFANKGPTLSLDKGAGGPTQSLREQRTGESKGRTFWPSRGAGDPRGEGPAGSRSAPAARRGRSPRTQREQGSRPDRGDASGINAPAHVATSRIARQHGGRHGPHQIDCAFN